MGVSVSRCRQARSYHRLLSFSHTEYKGGKALNGLKDWEKPREINTDKAPTYAAAIADLKQEGKGRRTLCTDRSNI
jgi:hypothetical protein